MKKRNKNLGSGASGYWDNPAPSSSGNSYGPTTYDQNGNVIPDVYPDPIQTSDPQIAKILLPDGAPVPFYVVGSLTDKNTGQTWGYVPTQWAIAAGKAIAAADTIAAVPQQIADTIHSAVQSASDFTAGLSDVGKWVVIGIIGLVAWEVVRRFPKGE